MRSNIISRTNMEAAVQALETGKTLMVQEALAGKLMDLTLLYPRVICKQV